MGDVRWHEEDRKQAREAELRARLARSMWPLALVNLDVLDHVDHYVVRKDPAVDLREAADAAFCAARDRGAFPIRDADEYFDVFVIDWAEAFARITPQEWIAAGIEIVAGPVPNVTLGSFESLALTDEPQRVHPDAILDLR